MRDSRTSPQIIAPLSLPPPPQMPVELRQEILADTVRAALGLLELLAHSPGQNSAVTDLCIHMRNNLNEALDQALI